MEVMVVVAMIGIVTAVGLVSINNSKITKALEGASHEVAAALREAQNNALTGRQTSDEYLSCGHGFYIFGSSEYKIYDNRYSKSSGYKNCPEAEAGLPLPMKFVSGTSHISANYSLKNGVVFDLDNSERDFYFKLSHAFIFLSDNLPFASGSSPKKIILKKDSRQYYLCVYPDGNVIENGTQSTCP